MRVLTPARGLTFAVAALLLTGCESMSSMPFMGQEKATAEQVVTKPAPEPKVELSRNEKISLGLSEELDWFPDLDEPLQQLESQYSAETTLAERSRTLSSIAYLHDARLFVLFQDMLDFLPQGARVNELKEQNTWLDRRKSLMTRAFLSKQDADEARLAAGQAFIDATLARIEEVEAKRKLIIIE